MKTLVLWRTMMKQTLIGLKRYMFETLTGVITLYLFFLALFYGAKAFGAGAPKYGDALEGLLVGYAVWSLAIFAYFSMAQDLVQEAQLGTLEQLAMSPLGLSRVLMGRVLAGLIWQSVTITILVVAMMASTGKWLHIDLLSIIPIALLTLAGVVGLSFIFGGLAIVFKKVQSALQIMQMVFIACLAIPLSRVWYLKFAPLSWGNRLLTEVMVNDQSLASLPKADILFLIAHASAYMTIGLVVFKAFERMARSRGLLGHY